MAAAVKTESQRDQAYRQLRRLLILQRIPEGQRLREPQWSQQLQVNRAALREAFARLEAEGLLAKGPKTGYFVPALSAQDMREVLQVRTMLECGAIEQICAAGKNTPAHLKTLKQACDELEDLLKRGYLLGASEADRRFHEAMIEAAGNQRLATVYQRAPLPMLHQKISQDQRWADECALTLREHRAVLNHLLHGQITEAQQQLRLHLSERYLLPLRG